MENNDDIQEFFYKNAKIFAKWKISYFGKHSQIVYRLFRKNMLCRQVMEINFLVMEKSWKVIVEKEWSPYVNLQMMMVIGDGVNSNLQYACRGYAEDVLTCLLSVGVPSVR